MDHIIRNLKNYWNNRVAKYGDTPKAAEWGNEKSQETRFKVLTDCINSDPPLSVVDMGCGTGALLPFLEKRFGPIHYTGIDISPKMIAIAKNKFPKKVFIVMDGTNSILPKADYYFLSGMLNKRIYADKTKQYRWAFRIIENMWGHCRHITAFNMLSALANIKVKSSFPYKPCKIVKRSLNFTRHVVLRHDYMPHDFTVYLKGGLA